MKDLKIAFLSYRSKPFSGGQGIYVRYLSDALQRRGHEITVFSGPPYPDLYPEVKLVKIPSLGLHEKRSKFFEVSFRDLMKPLNFFEWLSINSGGFPEPYTFGKRVNAKLRSQLSEFDIVHDNQCLSYELLKLQSKIPLVSTLHHPISKDLKYQLKSTKDIFLKLLMIRWHSFLVMQKYVAKRLNKIIVPSNSSIRDINEEFGVDKKKMTRIMNGIDCSIFYPEEAVPKINKRIVTVASSDVPLKGLDYLIHSLNKIKLKFPEVSLSVIGEKKKGGHTDRLINRLNLQGQINFFSNLTQDQIRKIYCESELAVIPSLYEGFGFAAIEAMACNVPLISTSGGALPEVIEDCGKIINPMSSEEIYSSVIEAFLNKKDYENRAKKGLNRIKKSFSWDEIAKQYEKVYLEEIISFKNSCKQ